jgi:hypothetical protein
MSTPTWTVEPLLTGERANSSCQTLVCRKPFPNFLILLCELLLCILAIAILPTRSFGQEGHHGVGHDSWHESFYSTLIRKDTKTSCCNLSDCRPTQSRMVDDHYEVKVDGAWLKVPKEAIQNVAAPDGGAHVCAPAQLGAGKGKIYCVVLPPET